MRLRSLSVVLALPFCSFGQSPIAQAAGTFIPDSVMAGVQLRDTTSAIAILGHVPADGILDDHSDTPRVSYFNRDSSEVLTLYIHHGGYLNEYSELRISKPQGEAVRATLPIERFSSGRGLELGLSEAEVVRIFGDKAVRNVKNNGNVFRSYVIQDFANSPFLQRLNYPSWYARFTFERDRLIDYRFGFEEP